MWKALLGFTVLMGCAKAQGPKDPMMPEFRPISMVVVDPEGNPIADARVDHVMERPHFETKTNAVGKFQLYTEVPAFVIRKLGFQSQWVRTQDAAHLSVVLRKLDKNQAFRIFGDHGKLEGLGAEGMGSRLQFPQIAGVKASRPGSDVDYVARSHYVATTQGDKGITHGSGPLWSAGMPSNRDVWGSVKYQELMCDVGRGRAIIDARGQLANGKRWRYLGMLGESASYSDMDEETASILDQVLDGACWNNIAAK